MPRLWHPRNELQMAPSAADAALHIPFPAGYDIRVILRQQFKVSAPGTGAMTAAGNPSGEAKQAELEVGFTAELQRSQGNIASRIIYPVYDDFSIHIISPLPLNTSPAE